MSDEQETYTIGTRGEQALNTTLNPVTLAHVTQILQQAGYTTEAATLVPTDGSPATLALILSPIEISPQPEAIIIYPEDEEYSFERLRFDLLEGHGVGTRLQNCLYKAIRDEFEANATYTIAQAKRVVIEALAGTKVYRQLGDLSILNLLDLLRAFDQEYHSGIPDQ